MRAGKAADAAIPDDDNSGGRVSTGNDSRDVFAYDKCGRRVGFGYLTGWIMLTVVAIVILVIYILLGVVKPAIAMLTFPFVCGMLACAGALQQSTTAMVLAPVIGFVTLVAVLFSKRSPEREQWPRVVARSILLTLLALSFIVLCFSAGGMGVLGLIFGTMFVAGVISYQLTTRRARAAEVVSTIGSSVRQNLPLPMALENQD